MTQVQSFAPVIGEKPRILILGSMPGVASLEAVQYYAHPRNAFWPIMGELFGIDPTTNYAQRIAQISQQPVVQANDIPGLLEEFTQIKAVACNGATSANYFRKLVLPQISPSIELLKMPSTSPANAAMNFAQKLAAWRRLLDFLD